jgi:hypothetical protein
MKSIFSAAAFLISTSFISPHKHFFAFNIYQSATDGTAKAQLERITARLQTVKGKSTSTVYEIAGAKSTRRINAVEAMFNASPDLISSRADPSTVIQLYKLEARKNKRLFSLTPDGKVQSEMIAVSFQSEDFGSTYKIILTGYLSPGEYAFIDNTTSAADGSVIVFAFGVD